MRGTSLACIGNEVIVSLLCDVEAHAAGLCRPEIVRLPGSGPVLLLAPHPDDEVLGAGGALCKHLQSGDSVSVLFVTDGRLGGRGHGKPLELAALRQREAIDACAALGGATCEFLGAEDGNLRPLPTLVSALREVILRVQPRLVYVPGFDEQHRDHVLTSALLAEAWRLDGGDWTVCAYEVWTPLKPNCVVNITRQMEQKRAALRCHRSQLEQLDYLHAMEGLAQYRSALIPLPDVRFAEAFWRSTPQAFTCGLERFVASQRAGGGPPPAHAASTQ